MSLLLRSALFSKAGQSSLVSSLIFFLTFMLSDTEHVGYPAGLRRHSFHLLPSCHLDFSTTEYFTRHA